MPVRVGLLLVVTAGVLGGLAMGVVYGAEDGLLTGALLLLMGLPVVALIAVVRRHRRRFGSLRWQLGLAVALAIGIDLVGVQAIATVLFVSAHDAFTLALLLAFAAVLAGYTAWSLARDVTDDLTTLRDAVAAVGEGDRDVRIDLPPRDELAELGGEIARMSRELEQRERERDAAERARRDLVAAVSHDLRTPLNALRLIARGIADGVVDERTLHRHLGQLTFHIASLDTLIDDLFELARIEAGDIDWPLERLSVADVIRETVEGMAALAADRGVALDVQAGELPPVRGNPEKLQRVLFNLVENALRSTPPGGRIVVCAAAGPDEVEVEVADTGHGIAPGEVPRVFEPLFRGGPDAARGGAGAGLGLPIARSIVEAHGGTIDIAASSSAGTRVRFTLPRADVARGDGEVTPAAPRGTARTPPAP